MPTTQTVTNSTAASARSGVAFIIWGALGVVFLALQIHAYAAWILSPGFRPTSPGPDAMPAAVRATMHSYQVNTLVILAVVLTWFVWGLVRTRNVDVARALMLGWLSAYWLDPFLDFLRPMFTYNASLVNEGCWCQFIPFWQAANGARIAEPLLVDGPSYFFTFPFAAYLAVWLMRAAKKIWPGINNLGLFFAGFAAVLCTFSLLDVAATRYMGFDAWPVAFQSLSAWGGQYFQFPIYEFILFPLPFVLCAFVVFYKNAEGFTLLERGLLRTDPIWRKNTSRILVFVAFCNVLNLVYTASMGLLAVKADPWPQNMPSWLADGQCGADTGHACGQ